MADKLTYQDLAFPFYRNTKHVFANLNTSDLIRAAVLGQLNMFLTGRPESGKTQVGKDIVNYYFGGSKMDGGESVEIRATPETDVFNEIATRLNIAKGERELTTNLEAICYLVDEINRTPEVLQNQFLGLGDGQLDYQGRFINVGKNGQRLLIATANIGNGEYKGTFGMDPAMLSRLNLTLNLDSPFYSPSEDDFIEGLISDKIVDPSIKLSGKRNIADRIKLATSEIEKISAEPGMEAKAVLAYLTRGLSNCRKNGQKQMGFEDSCDGCSHNAGNKELCSLILNPTPMGRTYQATRKYAAALAYLAELKDPKVQLDPVDLTFKAFELIAAYKGLLNQRILQNEYGFDQSRMMAEVVRGLREDFSKNEDYIMSSGQAAEQGERLVTFGKYKGQLCNYEALPKGTKSKTEKVEPYTNDRAVGLAWVKPFIEAEVRKTEGAK